MQFRQQALSKLQSPEEIDLPVRYARPRGGLVLVVTVVVMIAAGFWAVTGTVSSTVDAPGILTHAQGSYILQSPVAGQVTDVLAKEGGLVAADAPLLKVRTAQGSTVVRAIAAGRVTTLVASIGSVVTTGADVAAVERFDKPDEPLTAVLYVPADSGSSVPVGAAVDLTVQSVPTQQYGVLRGRVKAVGRHSTDTSADQRLPGQQPARRAVLQGRPAGSGGGAPRPVVEHQVRIHLVVLRRSPLPGRLDDPDHRRRPPGRAASDRLAASMTTQQRLPPAERGRHRPENARPDRRAPKAAKAKKRRAVRTPTVLQMEALECGAASLAMVLAHHGRHVPLEELRIACGVSRDGSRASNLLKAARSYGLQAKGMQMESAALAEVRAPAILFWEFNHYVVYDGMGRRFGRKGVHINDPAKGRRFVASEDFDTSFTGVALVFEPTAAFSRGGRKPGIMSALPARMRGTKGTLLAALLASLLLVAVGAAVPALSRTYIDIFLIGRQTSLLGPLFASMATMVALTAVLTALQQANLLRGRIISSTLSSARFLRHLLRLPVTFFAQRSPADLVQRLQSNDAVAETLARDIAAAGVDGVVVILYAVLLWTYDPQLTVIGVLVALLNVVAMRIVIRLRSTHTQKLRADSARLTNTSYTGLQLIETMKATGGENGYFRRWAGQHATTLEEQQRLGVPSAVLAVVAPLLATLNSALILWIGGLRAVEGHISIGLLVAFQALVTRFTAPITRLNGVAGRVQDFAADVARLKDVENFPVDTLYSRRPAGCQHPQAEGPCDAGGRHLRLQPAGQTAAHGLLAGRGARTAGRTRRRVRQRQVHRLPADLRPLQPLGGDDPHRRRAAGGHLAQRAGRLGVLRRPGRLPLRGHGPRQRGAVGPVDPGRGRDHRPAGRRPVRRDRPPPRSDPQPCRAGRPQFLRRPAAAAGDRPRPGAGGPASWSSTR